MPQSIVLQVGQCGNQVTETNIQIASKFWNLALQEEAKYNNTGVYNDSLSTFFRNVDPKKRIANINVGNPITALKARGIMIDMEEGVINGIASSPLNDLFDSHQKIVSNSGSGNNWGQGYHEYGDKYQQDILDSIRKEAEWCDSLQSFMLLHSTGGGTGSGLGSYISTLLKDNYSEVYKFAAGIVPSANDDVVTSPYNSILTLSKLVQNVDCILPLDNESLFNIYEKVSNLKKKKSASTLTDNGSATCKIYDRSKNAAFNTMNNIVANLLLNMTRIDQLFTDLISPEAQLISVHPKQSTYLASTIIVRGQVTLSDLRRNIDRIRHQLNFVPWNVDGWKTGLCDIPPLGQKYSVLSLSNGSGMWRILDRLKTRYLKLYKRRAHLHHYLQYMEKEEFEIACREIRQVIAEYQKIETSVER
ncbi:Tubulin epsilon chain [Terramyces sp. JEL0728]|nr:Tubulin epsilon chain [Terramyces sp. JEL0728]